MSLFGESPSNVAAGPLDCHDCRNRVKTIKEHTHTPHRKQLNTEVPWVSRAFESVSSYSFPTPLYDDSFRFIFHPIRSSAGVTNVGMRPINTVSVRLLFSPFFLFWFFFIFLFFSCRGEQVRENTDISKWCVCVIRGDRIAVSLLHCCCI